MVGRWLLKTEPEEWSWEHQRANGGISQWDGVRNALAQKHLRGMELGDLCMFYHSGSKAKEIVGIARVCKAFYPDPTDSLGKCGMVDIEAVSKLSQPLALARMKEEDGLHSFLMFRQPRLSVVPVSAVEWNLICQLAGQLEPPFPQGTNGEFGVDMNEQVLDNASHGASEIEVTPALPCRKADARARGNQIARRDNDTDDGIPDIIGEIEPTPALPRHKVDARARGNQIAQRDDDTDDGIPDIIGMPRQIKKQRGKRKAVTDINKLRSNVPSSPTAPSLASSLQKRDVGLNPIAQSNAIRSELEEYVSPVDMKNETDKCIPPHLLVTIAPKLVPDSQRVYRRRGWKGSKVEPLRENVEANEDLTCNG